MERAATSARRLERIARFLLFLLQKDLFNAAHIRFNVLTGKEGTALTKVKGVYDNSELFNLPSIRPQTEQ